LTHPRPDFPLPFQVSGFSEHIRTFIQVLSAPHIQLVVFFPCPQKKQSVIIQSSQNCTDVLTEKLFPRQRSRSQNLSVAE